jgi:hypothetical protein
MPPVGAGFTVVVLGFGVTGFVVVPPVGVVAGPVVVGGFVVTPPVGAIPVDAGFVVDISVGSGFADDAGPGRTGEVGAGFVVTAPVDADFVGSVGTSGTAGGGILMVWPVLRLTTVKTFMTVFVG